MDEKTLALKWAALCWAFNGDQHRATDAFGGMLCLDPGYELESEWDYGQYRSAFERARSEVLAEVKVYVEPQSVLTKVIVDGADLGLAPCSFHVCVSDPPAVVVEAAGWSPEEPVSLPTSMQPGDFEVLYVEMVRDREEPMVSNELPLRCFRRVVPDGSSAYDVSVTLEGELSYEVTAYLGGRSMDLGVHEAGDVSFSLDSPDSRKEHHTQIWVRAVPVGGESSAALSSSTQYISFKKRKTPNPNWINATAGVLSLALGVSAYSDWQDAEENYDKYRRSTCYTDLPGLWERVEDAQHTGNVKMGATTALLATAVVFSIWDVGQSQFPFFGSSPVELSAGPEGRVSLVLNLAELRPAPEAGVGSLRRTP